MEVVAVGAVVAGVGVDVAVATVVAAGMSMVVVVISGAICSAVVIVLSVEAIEVAPPILGRRSVEVQGCEARDRLVARRAKGKVREWLKEEEDPLRWLFNAVAPRFVLHNGQVRDFRHASDIYATCKGQAILPPRFPLASVRSIIVFFAQCLNCRRLVLTPVKP